MHLPQERWHIPPLISVPLPLDPHGNSLRELRQCLECVQGAAACALWETFHSARHSGCFCFQSLCTNMIPPLQNNMPVGTQDKVVFFLNICSHTKLGSTSVMTYSSVSDNKQWLKSRRCRTDKYEAYFGHMGSRSYCSSSVFQAVCSFKGKKTGLKGKSGYLLVHTVCWTNGDSIIRWYWPLSAL